MRPVATAWWTTLWFDVRPRAAIEADIRDELAFHLEMAAEANVRAGMSADEARVAAERSFGDVERTAAECRAVQLSERIMLQRINVVLIVIILVFVGTNTFLGSGSGGPTAEAVEQLREDVAALAASMEGGAAARPDRRMDGVVTGLDRMQEHLAGIDKRLALLSSPKMADGELAGTTVALQGGADVQALNQRLANFESSLTAAIQSAVAQGGTSKTETFEAMPDKALAARATALSRGRNRDQAWEAIDAWKVLLARNPAGDQRAEALGGLGEAYLKTGDNEAAEKYMRKALDSMDRNEDRAQGLSNMLSWTLYRKGDARGAIEELDILLAQPGITEAVESSVRASLATFALQTGDKDRARTELETVVRKWENSEHKVYRDRAEAARKRLEKL